jgi:hypothetical protein
MRQFLALFVAAVFALSFAGLAAAQSSGTATGGGQSGTPATEPPKSSTPGATTPGSSSPSSAAPSSSDTGKSSTEQPKAGTAGKSGSEMPKSATGTKDKAGAKTASMRGQHKMMGEVTKIDSAKGMVTVKTDEGNLDLHFPPSALQGMKEGDRVELQLSIRPAGAAAKSGETGKAPAAKGTAPSKPTTQTQ